MIYPDLVAIQPTLIASDAEPISSSNDNLGDAINGLIEKLVSGGITVFAHYYYVVSDGRFSIYSPDDLKSVNPNAHVAVGCIPDPM